MNSLPPTLPYLKLRIRQLWEVPPLHFKGKKTIWLKSNHSYLERTPVPSAIYYYFHQDSINSHNIFRAPQKKKKKRCYVKQNLPTQNVFVKFNSNHHQQTWQLKKKYCCFENKYEGIKSTIHLVIALITFKKASLGFCFCLKSKFNWKNEVALSIYFFLIIYHSITRVV